MTHSVVLIAQNYELLHWPNSQFETRSQKILWQLLDHKGQHVSCTSTLMPIHNFRPRSYSRERDEYYARHHRDHPPRERSERDSYRGGGGERGDRYYRERSRSPRSRDRERAEREKYYEVGRENSINWLRRLL